MIRIFNKRLVAVESGSVYVADIYCDSSDTKPTTELANGSTLTEVDTGKRYLFNEANTSWVEVSGGGGSSNYTEVCAGKLDRWLDQYTQLVADHYGGTVAEGMAKIYADYMVGNVSGLMEIDASALGISTPFTLPVLITGTHGQMWLAGIQNVGANVSNWSALQLSVSPSTESLQIYSLTAGVPQNLYEYASVINYTLTLYWHEMPTA